MPEESFMPEERGTVLQPNKQEVSGLLPLLGKKEVWDEFLSYKKEKQHLSRKDARYWTKFVEEEQYRSVTDRILSPDFSLSVPVKLSVNKSNTGKKRVVYSFPEKESMVLKLLGHLLSRYDACLSPSCYSFRKNITAKDAVSHILSVPGLSGKYVLKMDIRNYFNSMPVSSLLHVLKEILADDPFLYSFFERMLTANEAYEHGRLITEERGAMAGTPTSAFFADVYLLSSDNYFTERGIPYFRYSDDILILADSPKELLSYRETATKFIEEKGLSLNPDKLSVTNPGEAFEFLGFSIQGTDCPEKGMPGGKVDLSEAALRKMKNKIKRKAHLLYRRQKNNGKNTPLTFEESARILLKTFNRKYFDEAEEDRFTWSRWFFPVLTCTDGLAKLDAYLLSYVRFLKTGRHYKGNYRVRYEEIKALGYRSLVHEYYEWKNSSR